MRIKTRQREGVTIIEPKGKITIGEGDIALRDAIQEVLDSGASSVLINLKKVPRIDSSGLGELVAAHQRALGVGGQVKLVNLGSSVSNVVEVTQIHTVFDVFDNEDAAIASFA